MSELETILCPHCGRNNSPQNKFCIYCGMPLKAPSPEAPAPAPQTQEGTAVGATGQVQNWQTVYLALTKEINQLDAYYTQSQKNLEEKRKQLSNNITNERTELFTIITNTTKELESLKPDAQSWFTFQNKFQSLLSGFSSLRHFKLSADGFGAATIISKINTLISLFESRDKAKDDRDKAKRDKDKASEFVKQLFGCGGLFVLGIIFVVISLIFNESAALVSVLLIIVVSLMLFSSERNEVSKLEKKIVDLELEIGLAMNEVKQHFVKWNEAVRREVDIQFQKAIRDLEDHTRKFLGELEDNIQQQLQQWTVRRDAFLRQSAPWITEWESFDVEGWQPVDHPYAALLIGRITHPLGQQVGQPVWLPLLIPFRAGQGLLIQATGAARREAIKVLQNIGFRLLTAVPAGKLRFAFVDPVGLGESVASLLHLKDFDPPGSEESLVSFQAWTETDHIRKQLAVIKEHMTTVIQERLRDQYPDLETYNEKEGEVPIPYRALLIFDFPAKFNDDAAQQLLSIVQTGHRVGVFPVILFDPTHKLPYEFKVSELERVLPTITWEGSRWRWQRPEVFQSWEVHFDSPPPESLRGALIAKWGAEAPAGMRLEVPFARMLEVAQLQDQNQWWSKSASTEFRVPLGPITARKLQYLELGKGTLNHVLIGGRTGSGKSNLMHVLITAASLTYHPDEWRVYLIDLKTVEFAVYRDLPHAEAVAVDADREFAVSVIEGLDNEMRKRMEAFKNVGANDLAEYRAKTQKPLPRILLVIDEFQVLFEQDDRVAQEATRLLDRLVRQGRAFGIHVLLGSQSLSGHSLPQATINQIAVRIALQCSESDSRLILAEGNPAALRLSRPGQAIYNSQNGLIEGNVEFQVALFSDEDRDSSTRKILEMAQNIGVERKPIVFEGNEPARIDQCFPLLRRVEEEPLSRFQGVDTWLGESVSMRPPVSVRWVRRAGSHLGVVTREEEEGVGVLMATVLGLCAQYPPGRAYLYIADFSTPDAEWAEIPDILQRETPHGRGGYLRVLGRRELLEVLREWAELIRKTDVTAVPQEDRYLFIVGLHRVRDLRLGDEYRFSFSESQEEHPSAQLSTLLQEGPEFGIHIGFWCDTVANLSRAFERRSVEAIGSRVAGAMSEQDSQRWIDSAEASRLNKPHRMILYNDEQPGVLEKFRPYVIRDKQWLVAIGQALE